MFSALAFVFLLCIFCPFSSCQQRRTGGEVGPEMLEEMRETNRVLMEVRDLLKQQVRKSGGRSFHEQIINILMARALGTKNGESNVRDYSDICKDGSWEPPSEFSSHSLGCRSSRPLLDSSSASFTVEDPNKIKEITFLKNTVMECDACESMVLGDAVTCQYTQRVQQ